MVGDGCAGGVDGMRVPPAVLEGNYRYGNSRKLKKSGNCYSMEVTSSGSGFMATFLVCAEQLVFYNMLGAARLPTA